MIFMSLLTVNPLGESNGTTSWFLHFQPWGTLSTTINHVSSIQSSSYHNKVFLSVARPLSLKGFVFEIRHSKLVWTSALKCLWPTSVYSKVRLTSLLGSVLWCHLLLDAKIWSQYKWQSAINEHKCLVAAFLHSFFCGTQKRIFKRMLTELNSFG